MEYKYFSSLYLCNGGPIIPNHQTFLFLIAIFFSQASLRLHSAMPSDQATADASWVPGDFEHPNEELRQSVKISLMFAFTLPTIAVILRIWAENSLVANCIWMTI